MRPAGKKYVILCYHSQASERASFFMRAGVIRVQTVNAAAREAEALQWWRRLRETNNDAFLPLFFETSRFLVLCGGGGSGKSIFAGRKVLERVTSEPGHRWLVCRKVARTLRDSCFKQLRDQLTDGQGEPLYPHAEYRVNLTDMRLTFSNGSEILFAGLDDVEKLKSIYNITGIWIEEASELEEGDLNQLDIRLRGETPYYKQIILTFNPISATHWLKRRFFDEPKPNARTHRSTYRDNRFLDEEAKAVLEGFRETDEYYYQVYCLGQWGVTGRTIFNAAAVSRRLREVTEPVRRGCWEYTLSPDGVHVSGGRWADDKAGPVKIYREAEAGRPYVIGADTAGEGSDMFAAQVLDNITGEQVAVLHHRYDEDTFARQLYWLGREYNDALIGVETNFSSYPVRLLELMGYPHQYVREVEDEFTGALRRSFGFKTTSVTRPVIIGELVRVMREADNPSGGAGLTEAALTGVGLINDAGTLEEMLTFVRNEKLRPEAEPGAHDDLVLALAIAYYIRPQGRTYVEAPEAEGVSWTADMWDDWRRATPEAREYLVQKWGKPKN